MTIRKSTYEDIPSILEIIQDAKDYLKSQNIDQWQGPYPEAEDIQEDIDRGVSYVYEENDKVIGSFNIEKYQTGRAKAQVLEKIKSELSSYIDKNIDSLIG